MSDFEDRAGVVPQATPWGRWYQTLTDVNIEVDLIPGTKGREVKVDLNTSRFNCTVRGATVIQGALFDRIKVDDSTWTIEDSKLLRIVLVKAGGQSVVWTSLLAGGQFGPDPHTLIQMRKKIDLEKYQVENPGFDFSDANLDKNYDQRTEVLDELELLGASALPQSTPQNTEDQNKTDDEKLLESQGWPAAQTQDQLGNLASSLAAQRLEDAVSLSPDNTRYSNGDAVQTDDMKTSAGESLETDEEKSGE